MRVSIARSKLTEHAQVRDGNGAALELVRLQFAVACLQRQLFHLLVDVHQTLAVSLRHNRGDQTAFGVDGHAQINGVEPE